MRLLTPVLVAGLLAGCASREPDHALVYRQPAGVFRETNPAEVAGAPRGFSAVTGRPGNERHGYGSTPDEAAHHAGATSWQTAEPIETVPPAEPPTVSDRVPPETSPIDDPAEECPGGVCRIPDPTPGPIDDRERCGPPSPPAAPPVADRPPDAPLVPLDRDEGGGANYGLLVLAVSLGALVVVLSVGLVYTLRALRRSP